MKLEDIKNIGVVGAGIMGSGIAQIFARKGYKVLIVDISQDYLEKSRKLIDIFNKSLIEENIMHIEEIENVINNISYSTHNTDLSDSDIIIEAIIEKMGIKQEFWRNIEKTAKANAIFATNTSGLSITEISMKIKDKSRFIGAHFWNPPHIIPLVEIIRAVDTVDETVDTLVALIKKIGKEPVVVKKDSPGFIGNRLQFALFREAVNIVEQGIADIEDVDKAMKYGPGFRYPIIGPFETADLGGLDTFYYISSYLFNELSDVKEPQNLIKELIDNNQLGVKTQKGLYDYSDGKDEEFIKHRDKMLFKMLKHIYNS